MIFLKYSNTNYKAIALGNDFTFLSVDCLPYFMYLEFLMGLAHSIMEIIIIGSAIGIGYIIIHDKFAFPKSGIYFLYTIRNNIHRGLTINQVISLHIL